MPQEAWVLKCYQCKKFQVQLKKKAKKWQCKVCGAKQDLMTIFFKGQPSDCRVNVQNMNTAEGQIFEKLKDCSTFQDENYYEEDEFENMEQNLPESACFSNQNSENFVEEVVAQLNDIDQIEEEFRPESASFSNQNSECFTEEALSQIDEFDQLEYEFQPSAFDIDGFNETQERSFKENVSMHKECTSSNSQSVNNGDDSNKDNDYFDLNTIDFTIKTFKPSFVSKKKEALKLSIFESNGDFDESLDF